MKYLILIYDNPKNWEELSDAKRRESLRACIALDEDLARSGELIASEVLADPSMGKRVIVRDGRTMTTDGPFAEAKEYLAGFYLVECDSIERAIEHGARAPESADGLVEVRPVLDIAALEL